MGLVVEELPELGVIRLSRWIFDCYVIRTEDGGAVVVDAGLPQTPDDVAPYLDRLDRPTHAIVATHGHSDHVAGAAELARRYGARIFCPPRQSRIWKPPGLDHQPRPPQLASGRHCSTSPLTGDSVAFWNPAARVLLSGDAVLSAGAGRGIPPKPSARVRRCRDVGARV